MGVEAVLKRVFLVWGGLWRRALWGGGGLLLAGCTVCQDIRPEGPKTLAPYRATSKPYKIKGIWYYPQQYYEFEEVGIASWYGGRDGTHGHFQATGVRYDMFQDTAAHKTLPIPCMALVTNLENGRSLVVKVSDRGPFKYQRILDLSVAAAQKLGFYRQGTTLIKIKTLVAESVALEENQRAYARAKEPQRSRRFSGRAPRKPNQKVAFPNPARRASTPLSKKAAGLERLLGPSQEGGGSRASGPSSQSLDALLRGKGGL